jgi:methionyl-tRNA formyltransferase
MNIVFIGAVEFSRHTLGEVIAAGGNVVAVLTLEAENARFNSDYADLRPLAEAHGIPVHLVKGTNSPETVALVKSYDPDVVFVFGWSRLLADEMLAIPRLGCVGVHPALLPKNRGRHPLIWALVEGLTESGLTFFYLDAEADSGDILWQRPFPIVIEDDAADLYEKMKSLASLAIHEFVPQLADGTATRIPQDHSLATYWRKRGKEDGVIDWSSSSMVTYNLIRALARPYVGANSYLSGENITFWRAKPPLRAQQPRSDVPPGTIVAVDQGTIEIATGDGTITLLEYEYEGSAALVAGTQLGGQA